MKQQELENQIKKAQFDAKDGFRVTDFFLGCLIGVFGSGLIMWLPFIGLIIAPMILIVSPFCGTLWRKQIAEHELKKLKKKLNAS